MKKKKKEYDKEEKAVTVKRTTQHTSISYTPVCNYNLRYDEQQKPEKKKVCFTGIPNWRNAIRYHTYVKLRSSTWAMHFTLTFLVPLIHPANKIKE